MGAEELQGLNDVALCYQSMGLPIGSSRELVDQRYLTLREEYRKKSASSGPAVREEARAGQQA